MMKTKVIVAPIVLGALIAACSDGGNVRTVNEPLSSVYDKLVSMPAEADVMDLAEQMPRMDHYLEQNGGELIWHFRQDEKDYCRFYAMLNAAGDNATQLSTRAEPSSEAANAAVEAGAKKAPDYQYFCNMARLVGEESVAAAIEGRAANKEALQASIRKYVASDPLAVQGAAAAAMDEAVRVQGEWNDPSQSSDPKKRADWESLQRVRAEQRRNQPPPPPGTFRMDEQ